MTIHIAYPFDENKIATPWAIGNNLASYFRRRNFDVKQYDWLDVGEIKPAPGDIMIGHPCSRSGYIVSNSFMHPNWSKKWFILPITISSEFVSVLDVIFKKNMVDGCFFISGPYWWDKLPSGWNEKCVCLDLGIDVKDYPKLIKNFHPPGERRFLYIGHRTQKNADYLDAIVKRCSETHFGHMGKDPFPGMAEYGYVNFSEQGTQNILSTYDYLITVSNYDANPTVVLEAMAWGLIPIATETSGWLSPPTIKFPLNDIDEAEKCINSLQEMDEDMLFSIQEKNRALAENFFTWNRFCETIENKIFEGEKPCQ